MNIAIGGLSGSGKGTLAKLIAKKLNLKGPFSAGDIFRKMAKENGYSLEEFHKIVKENPEYDKKIDEEIKFLSFKEDGAVFEGRLPPYICNAQLKIYLECPLETRAERVAKRDKIPFKEALQKTKFRDNENHERFKNLYGIDTNNLSIFDLILDSEKNAPQELLSQVLNYIKKKKI